MKLLFFEAGKAVGGEERRVAVRLRSALSGDRAETSVRHAPLHFKNRRQKTKNKMVLSFGGESCAMKQSKTQTQIQNSHPLYAVFLAASHSFHVFIHVAQQRQRTTTSVQRFLLLLAKNLSIKGGLSVVVGGGHANDVTQKLGWPPKTQATNTTCTPPPLTLQLRAPPPSPPPCPFPP